MRKCGVDVCFNSPSHHHIFSSSKSGAKMLEEKLGFNPHFFNLITMFTSACWQQLGKVQSHIDGKIHRDLQSAQITIDMLIMIRDKMKGNLNKKEEDMLASTISNLQLNYADEIAKPQDKVEDKKETDRGCGCGHKHDH